MELALGRLCGTGVLWEVMWMHTQRVQWQTGRLMYSLLFALDL